QSLQVRVLSEKLNLKLPPFVVRAALSLARTWEEVPHLTRVVTLAAAAPLGPIKPNSSRLFGEGMGESFAEPFVVPLARAEERSRLKAHLFVTGLLIRSARPAIRVRDPVVHTVQP